MLPGDLERLLPLDLATANPLVYCLPPQFTIDVALPKLP